MATVCTAIQCSTALRRAAGAEEGRGAGRTGADGAERVVVVISVGPLKPSQSSADSRPARRRISRVVTAIAIAKSTSESTQAAPVLKFWKPSEYTSCGTVSVE